MFTTQAAEMLQRVFETVFAKAAPGRDRATPPPDSNEQQDPQPPAGQRVVDLCRSSDLGSRDIAEASDTDQ